MDRPRLSALLADYYWDIAQRVGLNLEMPGFRMLTAEDGPQCMRPARCAILDPVMPDFSVRFCGDEPRGLVSGTQTQEHPFWWEVRE